MNSARQAVAFLCLVLFVAPLLAQDSPPTKSLAELASQSGASKKKAASVINDDNFQRTQSIIPDIFSNGVDNTDEILKAVTDYRKVHKPAETEEVIHDWFTKYDERLASAIDENRRIEQRAADRQILDGYRYEARTPGEYQAEYENDLRNKRDDYQRHKENGLLCARIQQTFQKVRSGLRAQNLNFEWFKIRCGNGNCSF